MQKGTIPTLEEVTAIINTKIRDRNQKQSANLFEFFNYTNFGTVLKTDMLLGQINLQTLFFFLSQFLEIQTYSKNEVIYYEGSRGEFLYLLLKGSVNLFKLTISTMTYSPMEYYLNLINIFNKGGKFLLEKTIRLNNEIFPVNKTADVFEMEKILRKVQLVIKAYNSDIDGIKELLTSHKIPFESVEFDKVITGEIPIDEYYQEQSSLMNEAEVFYFKILSDDRRREISIAELSPSYTIGVNEYFGNFKLGDFDNKRGETAIADEKSIIIGINKRLYSTCILNDKRNIREKEIETIHQNSFFKLMRKNIFAKNFFYELDLVEVFKNTMIFNEGDTVSDIYLVKEGTFELSIDNKNVFDLKGTIAHLKKLDEAFKLKEYDDVISLKNSTNALTPLMKVKKNYSLFVTEKDVFGLWEYVYQSKMIYNVRVISDKAKLYRLSVKKLEREDNEDFNLLQKGIKSEGAKKIKNVLERMIMLKNSVMMKIDIEFTKKTKEDEDNYYRQNTTVNIAKNSLNSNKVSINFKKDSITRTKTKSYKNIVTGYKKILSVFKPNRPNIGLTMETILRTDLKHRKIRSTNNLYSDNKTMSDESKPVHKHNISGLNKEEKILTKLQKMKKDFNMFDRNEIIFTNANAGKLMNSYEETKTERLPKIQPHRISLKKRSSKKKKQTIVHPSTKLHKEVNLNVFLSDDLTNNVKNINYLAVRKFYDDFKPHNKIYK